MNEINVTLPNGQQIKGTAQPDGTVRVTEWPRPSRRPFMARGLAMILEQDFPEDAAALRQEADRWDAEQANPICGALRCTRTLPHEHID